MSQQIIVNEEWQTEEGTQVFYDKNKTLVDGQNNVYIVGSTINGSGNYDILTAKYNSYGQLIWMQQYNGAGNGQDYGVSVAVDNSYNVFVVGTAYIDTANNNDLILLKYNSSGVQQWARTFNGNASGNDYAADVTIDNVNGVYVTGGVIDTVTQLNMITLCYHSGNGYLNWERRYDAYGYNDGAVRISNGSTNLTVMGGVQYNANTWRYAVLAIRKTDGKIERSFIYTAGSSNIEKVTGLTTDASENIYICGAVSDTGTGLDLYAIKLDSALIVQWEYTYNGRDSLDDVANAIGIDGNSNVYLTGYTTCSVQGKNYITVKLNSSGQQQWAVPYNNPSNGTDEATALVIDNSANVFVTGYSHNGNNFDYFTIKYETDSTIAWVKSFDNYNRNEKANDIALDNTGNIVVTGQSVTNNNYKYFTVQYAEYYRTIELSSDTTHIENEIIIKFAPEHIDTNFINRKGFILGSIEHFVTDDNLRDHIESVLGFELGRNVKLLKIHKNLTTHDTISTTRLGEQIRIPEFWSSFVMLIDKESVGSIDVLSACDELYSNLFPDVIYANPNLMMYYMGIPPNDNYYSNQNSLQSNTYQDIDVEEAWNYETGKEHIKVGIMDGGVNVSHEDFKFTANDCVVNTGLNPSGIDYYGGHGTSVAGIIGAVSNNSIGIAGIAGGNSSQNPKEMGVEMIDLNSGYANVTAEMMAEAIVLASTSSNYFGYGVNIINISMAYKYDPGAIENHDELASAVEHTFKNNVILVCARGNKDGEMNRVFAVPAVIRNDWVLNVGSNQPNGAWNNDCHIGYDMDLRAPGPHPGNNDYIYYVKTTSLLDYGNFGSTSCAAPHVSGTAALMLSYYNDLIPNFDNLTHEDVEHIIKFSTNVMYDYYYNQIIDRITILQTYLDYQNGGYGDLNAGNALKMIDKTKNKIFHYKETNISYSPTSPIQVNFKLRYPYIPPINSSLPVLPSNTSLSGDKYKFEVVIPINLPNDYYVDTCWALASMSTFWGTVDNDGFVWPDSIMVGCNNQSITVTGYMYDIDNYGFYPPINDLNYAYSIYAYHSITNINKLRADDFDFEIKPNPSSNFVTITLNTEFCNNYNLQIFDITGRVILREEIIPQQCRLDLYISHLKAGLYLVNIQSQNGTKIKKLIIN